MKLPARLDPSTVMAIIESHDRAPLLRSSGKTFPCPNRLPWSRAGPF